MNARPYPPDAGREVILVEDERRLRDMLCSAMHEMHFRCTGVTTAEAALRLLEERPFDIAILDLNLPGMSGLELFQIMHKRWPEIRVIVLTGFGGLDAARKAIHMDVVDFLTKPATLRDIELALERAREKRLANWQPSVAPEALEPEADEDLEEEAEDHDPAAVAEENPPDSPPPSPNATRSLDDIERESILSALKRHNGNRAEAAAELGISVRKLYYRLVQYQKQGFVP